MAKWDLVKSPDVDTWIPVAVSRSRSAETLKQFYKQHLTYNVLAGWRGNGHELESVCSSKKPVAWMEGGLRLVLGLCLLHNCGGVVCWAVVVVGGDVVVVDNAGIVCCGGW